jgi:hypothetical protein
VDKPRSVDESFLFAIVDFIPKSVTQREDHGIKLRLCLSVGIFFSSFE